MSKRKCYAFAVPEHGVDLTPREKSGATERSDAVTIEYQGSTKKEIDLNHMLRSSQKKNRFRSALEEIIDADLLLELEYLLCNKYLSNLRNNNYHEGYDNLDEYTLYEAAAFYFLVEAYCLAHD